MKCNRPFLSLLVALALSACAGGSGDPPAGDDMTVSDPDVGEPDMTKTPDPDMGEPEPDMGEPEPEPDMGEPEPEPDMGEPEPDMGEPDGCVAAEETCNGADDDCDGEIDEGFEVGAACAEGEGACAAEGTTVCAEDGAGTVCDATPGEPGNEVCDGLDNDCDGAVDEGLGGDACETGEAGICDAGTIACIRGEPICVRASEPTPELCDGLDNDCNGVADDVEGTGQPCTIGTGACAVEGLTACTEAGIACDAEPAPAGVEACNGIDDDCDGRTDELPECGVEICDNGGDDDGDGQVDCADPDCADFADCLPPPAEDCGNGADDDGDGAVDCLDPDCVADPRCVPPPDENCINGADDDGDGAVDCDDPDCLLDPACGPPRDEICDNRLDDDDDGAVDCDDPDCALDPACPPPGGEDCDNGADDDGDGAVDCDDPDCAGDGACLPPAEICDNGEDDDDDGAVDCDDPDCAALPVCLPEPEICDNGGDDDGDGVVDCDDPDCAVDPACNAPELCANGEDDDGDDQVDCDDPDCAFDPVCVPQVELCDNGLDDDGDGQVDCADADCQFDPACVVPPELCDNGVDDDLDGDIDCADADCAFFVDCLPDEVCDNAEDDDFDGAVDCLDPDCADDAACAVDDVTPIAAPGGLVALEGQLDAASPLFDRPDAVCEPGELDTRFRAHRIINLTGAPQVIDVEADWGIGDGYLIVYSAPFDPEAPLDGCLIGNDDDGGLAFSAVRDFEIQPGQELVVVATTFDPESNLGPYTITITTRVPPQPELCEGGADEDQDGLIDCADPDCAGDAACGPTAIAPPGESLALEGLLDADSPTYDREAAGCAPSNSPGRRFQAFPVINLTGADQFITATARWNVGDGYLFVYRAPFDPLAPAVGCIDGNDDFGGLTGSQVAEVAIAAGEELVIVATSFDPGAAIGPFDLSVQTLEEGPAIELCDNLADDDGDGLADCDDPDCADFAGCDVPPELCQNGVDDDGDGAVDCDDLDCADVVQCQGEVCDNGVDDNGDGAVDCADLGCAQDPACDGCPVIDFEDGAIPPYMLLLGDAQWFVDGGAASSGEIGAGESSGMATDVFIGPDGGRVQFAYRASSETNFDFLRFLVDDVDRESWSGDTGFIGVSFDLEPGLHRLEWRYTKDGNLDRNEDRGLIDDIVVLGAVACPGDDLPAVSCPADDRFESNDDPADATPIEAGRYDELARCTDDDYYAIDVCAGGTLTVDVEFVHADGDIDIELLDAAGAQLDLSESTSDDEQVTHTADVAETVFARVYFRDNVYALVVSIEGCVEADGTCASPFAADDVVQGSTAGADSALGGSCGGDGSPEAVHLLAGDGGTYCIDTEGTAFDTVLYAFAGACGVPDDDVACNDDSIGLQSQIELPTDDGVDYLIVVDGYSGFGEVNDGDYVLNVTPGACP